VHGWRGDFGRVPPARLARLLGAGDPVGLASLPLPHGTTGLAIGLSSIGVGLELDIALVLPSGAVTTIPLVAPGAPAAFERQKIPPGARVFALELRQKAQEAQSLVHREAEDTASLVPHGRLELSPLVAVGGSRLLGKVTDWRGWIGRNGVTVVSRSPLRLRYAFPTGQTALLRLPQRTDGTALPVAVSPDVARAATSAGKLSLTFGDEPVTGRVVAVARRFPGTEDGDGSFVVADESRLRTALDADDPGAGHLDEAWVGVSPAHAAQVAAALQRPPFAALDVVSRRGVAHGLRTDPLARGIELTLAAAALVALLLAVGGLWLAVLGDVADEHGELYDLEAQGFEPRDLRGQLRLRAGLVALAGLVGGLVLGLVLVSQVVRLVGISAAGSVPVPPLVLALGWHDTVLGLAAVVATGALLVELTVRRAFSGDTPKRSGEAT
jgi:hypothetical protein